MLGVNTRSPLLIATRYKSERRNIFSFFNLNRENFTLLSYWRSRVRNAWHKIRAKEVEDIAAMLSSRSKIDPGKLDACDNAPVDSVSMEWGKPLDSDDSPKIVVMLQRRITILCTNSVPVAPWEPIGLLFQPMRDVRSSSLLHSLEFVRRWCSLLIESTIVAYG